jgi:hypothetical protein
VDDEQGQSLLPVIPRFASTSLISSRMAGSSIVAGIFHASPVGDFLHGRPQDLARTGLGQPLDHHHVLERRNRTDLVAHKLDHFLLDSSSLRPFCC